MDEWRGNENVREKDGERKGERRRFIGFKPSDARFPKWRVLCIHKWHSCGTKRPPLFSGLVPLLTGIDEITLDIVIRSITITYHRADPLFFFSFFIFIFFFFSVNRLFNTRPLYLFNSLILLSSTLIEGTKVGLIVLANSVQQSTYVVG